MDDTMVIATPDRCKYHNKDQCEMQGVEANTLFGCYHFQNTVQKVWCGVMHPLPYHHHTIAIICVPVCENQSPEMKPDITEETHRRLVWALTRNFHIHHKLRRRHQPSNFTYIAEDVPCDSWAQLPCLYDMLNPI